LRIKPQKNQETPVVLDDDISSRWYKTHEAIPTRCKTPAIRLASVAFQHNPFPLEIEWVREEHAGFFLGLAKINDALERAQIFHSYALARFWANEALEERPDKKEQARRGYIALIRGWGYDSNCAAGAVLKGCAQRLG
jgi:NAD+---dinitrogen-reductase ADP-D-ribosyltransferase